MTLKEFKSRMHVGALVHTTMYMALPNGDGSAQGYQKVWEIPERKVSISQSNSFAFATPQPDGRVRDSWCNWPKAGDIVDIDESTVGVTYPGGKLVYQWLVPLEPMNITVIK